MNKERKTSYAAYAAWNYEKEEDRINEESKKCINLLITLLVISIFTGFNYIIALSFLLVFLYTAKNLYISNKE